MRIVNDLASNDNLPVGDGLQSGRHAKGGRLATAGRSQEGDEFSVANIKIEPVESRRQVRPVLLYQLFVKKLSHCLEILDWLCRACQKLLTLRIEDDQQMGIDAELCPPIYFKG